MLWLLQIFLFQSFSTINCLDHRGVMNLSIKYVPPGSLGKTQLACTLRAFSLSLDGLHLTTVDKLRTPTAISSNLPTRAPIPLHPPHHTERLQILLLSCTTIHVLERGGGQPFQGPRLPPPSSVTLCHPCTVTTPSTQHFILGIHTRYYLAKDFQAFFYDSHRQKIIDYSN